jgi:hypothetical protein
MAPSGLTRALGAAYSDPVEEFKRQALSNAGARPARAQNGGRLGVRTRVGFLLVVMVAGAPLGVVGWATTLLTLLSVLFAQELPFALWARLRQRSACIVLSASGSDTEISGPPLSPRSVFILALLGSLANLGVAALLMQLARRAPAGPAAPLLSAAAVAHLLWGFGQALPLTPFRFGRAIARRLRAPVRFAYVALSFICMSVTGLWALHAPGFPSYFSIFILAMVASTSALREAFHELNDQQSGVAALAAAACARLRDDQPEQAMALARRALANASVESNRTPLWKTLAWAAIGKRDPFTAHGALLSLDVAARDLHLVAAYLACCNRSGEAIDLLQQARRHGHRVRETSLLLVDLLFQAGQQSEALAVAETDRGLLAAADWQAIESSVAGGRAAEGAPALVSVSSQQS